MTRYARRLFALFVIIAGCSMYGCEGGGGIGVGAPVGGTRWTGGSSTGPGVIVMGGPVYR